MFGRRVLFVVVLAVAAVAPYFLANEESRGKLSGWWRSFRTDRDSADHFVSDAWDPTESPHVASYDPSRLNPYASIPGATGLPQPRVQVPPVQSFAQIFRFDVTPSWVMTYWPRVTTRLVELELKGLRVTLVTGTNIYDLAGSLTYYFDQTQQLQRISFHGHTGDQTQFVAFVTQYHGLRPEPSLGAGMFLAKWNGKATSVLRIRIAPVVRVGKPHQRFQVDLELNRPQATQGLSSEFSQLLDQDRKAGRWGDRG